MPSSQFFSLKSFDKWLIHKDLHVSSLELRKARVLVSIHLFLFFISFSIELSNSIFYPLVNNPPLKIAMAISISLLVAFRYFGNFLLAGNLLSFFLFIILIQPVHETGGLYSDNLLWMMAAPLLALLFANVSSGLYWLLALIVFTCYLYVIDVRQGYTFREQTLQLDGFYYLVSYSGLFVMVVGIVLFFATGQAMIINALNAQQKELTRQKAELARQTQSLIEAEGKLLASNKELEQFAYAASHDLKEPLRMIGSYTQLIKRKLSNQSDQSTVEYMGYVTDGVSRMEKLLNDLLEYSRLGRRSENDKEINLNDILLMVMGNLVATMSETDAAIYSNPLPVVKASSTEMIRLFQNLISNSIKFRRSGVNPVIEICHQTENGQHIFHLQDNGIGIPAEHREGVFNIFERLHSHQEYEGTGIGLATCKKIVTAMGGKIWVEPKETSGTAFIFTVPKTQAN